MGKSSFIIETPERLHRLTDIIFALSMVLFILEGMLKLKDPSLEASYNVDPKHFFLGKIYELFISFLVFLFLAIYWYTNSKQSKYLSHVDATYTWISILFLFFIAVAPLPNALSIQYSSDFYVQLFFSTIMFFIGALSFLGWYYASKNHRLLRKEITDLEIRSIRREMAVEPLVAILAIIATLIDTALWEAVLLLMPVGIVAVNIIDNRDKKKEMARMSQG